MRIEEGMTDLPFETRKWTTVANKILDKVVFTILSRQAVGFPTIQHSNKREVGNPTARHTVCRGAVNKLQVF